jgi:Domain of unknown function (DUF4193)
LVSDELDEKKSPDDALDDSDDEDEVDDSVALDIEAGDDDEEAEADEADEDEADADQTSLEELMAQRAAGRRGRDDAEEPEDIMSLSSEPEEPPVDVLPVTVDPIEDQKEFVCNSCHLVKPRVQMADPERGYCRDCV